MNRVRPPESFIRFVVPRKDEDSNRPQGVFRAAYRLRESGTLTAAEVAHISDTVEWFERNVTSPRSESIGDLDIFWFKASATEVIQQMWGLVNVLRAHDIFVEVLRTDWPGRISYEDEHQVAALGPRRGGVRRA